MYNTSIDLQSDEKKTIKNYWGKLVNEHLHTKICPDLCLKWANMFKIVEILGDLKKIYPVCKGQCCF